jgi:hypothetical protein
MTGALWRGDRSFGIMIGPARGGFKELADAAAGR